MIDRVDEGAFWLRTPAGPALMRIVGDELVGTRDAFGRLLLVRWRLPSTLPE